MTNWTKEQTDAIQDNGGSLLVSAAAGSGKTTVLVERAMRLICAEQNSVSADSLLIMTFTNAAAAELKSRLAIELEKRILQNPKDSRLARQRLLIQRAKIGTVDAFCKQLVSENFNILGVPSDVSVATDADIFDLSQQTLADVIEQMYLNPDFAQFCDTYGRSRSDNIAETTILRLHSHISCFPQKQKQLENILDSYKNPKSLADSIWGKQLTSQATILLNKAKIYLQRGIQIIDTNEDLFFCQDMFAAELAFVNRLENHIENGEIDTAVLLARGFTFGRFPSKRGIDNPNKDTIKFLRDNAKGIITDLLKSCFVSSNAEFLEDAKQSYSFVCAIVAACKMYDDMFFAAKLQEKKLEFSDFEHLALNLLVDENQTKTDFAKQLSRQYSVVMVDEYQDTNAIQNLIYHSLANEAQTNLFFVGDIKQSIYRFRQANPDIFIAKRDDFCLYNAQDYPATIILGHNFRSEKAVIEGVNDIFSSIMSRTVGGVDYTSQEKLYTLKTETNSLHGVDIQIIDCTNTDETSDAIHIANQIKQMLENGETIQTKTGERKIKPHDIAILLRSANSQAVIYEKALENVGVPAFVGVEQNILQVAETQPIIAALRVIDNPNLDVALSAVLLSPMFNFTPTELTDIRLCGKDTSLYTALLNTHTEKPKNFIKTLENLTSIASTQSPYTVYKKLLVATDYQLSIGGMQMGATRRESIKTFTAFIKSYNGVDGLSGFLRYLDNALQTGSCGNKGSKTAPNGFVNIISIHASKGLEFPVCFVAQLQRKFNMIDTYQSVLLDDKLFMGLNLKNSAGNIYHTAMHKAINIRMRKEQLSEEMRILYVALTRAKQKLVLTIAEKNPLNKLLGIAKELLASKKIDEYTLQTSPNFATWILYAAMATEKSKPIWEQLECSFEIDNPLQGENININIFEAPQLADETAETINGLHFLGPVDAELLQKLKTSFDQKVQTDIVDTLPIKTSVSTISHKANASNDIILQRPSFMYKQGLSAAEKGTVMHSFLQYADFRLAQTNLLCEKQRLINMQFVSADLMQKLDDTMVENFLQSDICKQILCAETVLREYDFITAVSANMVDENQNIATQIYVQGIADCVIINGNRAVLVDYKTDKGKTEQQFIDSYKTQLQIYKQAIEKRLEVTVEKCVIYSLQLAKEIVVL